MVSDFFLIDYNLRGNRPFEPIILSRMRYYDELDGSRLGNLKPTADMISSWNDELI